MSVEYRGQFADRLDTEWTIDVENDAYSSAVKEFVMAGDPINFEFLSPSDELLYPPVKGSMANFRVISDSHFKYAGLFAQSDFAFPVKIYHRKPGQLITDWTNDGYDTFTSSGAEITSAITDGSASAYAYSNAFRGLKAGDKIRVDIYIVLYTGAVPYVYLRNELGEIVSSLVLTTIEENTIELTCTADTNQTRVWLQTDALGECWTDGDVVAEEGNKLFWSGWIAPASYSEPYDSTPYTVNIACTDGLGLLKNVEFKDGDDYYNGRMTEAAILFEIFDKIDITGFKEFVNIYEDNMDEDVDDSPLDQTYIDVDVFRDMNCYEVLEYLLIKWNAIIRQWEGEYIIYRPIEMSAATIYGRKFTDATTKTAVTLTTGQLISRKTAETNYLSIDGGTLNIAAAAKEVIFNFDYGSKDSWVRNWELGAETYRNNNFDEWQQIGSLCVPISQFVAGEQSGVAMSAPLEDGNYLYQGFATNAVASSDQFVFEFDFGFYNPSAGTINDVRYYFKIWSLDQTLKDGTAEDTLVWEDVTTNYVTDIFDVESGWSGWTTVTKRISGLPENGFILIQLIGSNKGDDCIVCYRNIRWYAASESESKRKSPAYYARLYRQPVTGSNLYKFTSVVQRTVRQYRVENNISQGDILEFDHILGDVKNSGIANVSRAVCRFAGFGWCGANLHMVVDRQIRRDRPIKYHFC
jgi:hypothetical protein